MVEDNKKCNAEMINRYIDGETSPPETKWIDRHLQSCPGCRQSVQQHRELAQRLHREVSAAREALDIDRLEQQIVSAARMRAGQRSRLRETLFSWKLMLPVAATAALALYFFTSLLPAPAPTGPSAVINSFTGRVSSVMILETPQSRQTVIWFSEEAKEGNGAESKQI